MAVEITVILDGTAGGMARVVAALKRFGLTFAGHRIESINGDQSRLTVNAQGQAVAEELRNGLASVKGVVDVVGIGTEGAAAPGRRQSRAPSVQGGGFNELVDQIVGEYPKILRFIDAFEGSASGGDRSQQLRRLGQEVGRKMGGQDHALQGSQTLHEALENAVVPVLDRIADPEVVGSDIRVRLSIFTRRQVNTMDLVFGGEASRCDFLSGMIEGMIADVSALPNVHVEETSCRTNGDEYCLFRISS